MFGNNFSLWRTLHNASRPVCETLEHRRLLSGGPSAQSLPISIGFGSSVQSTILDSNGQGTGFGSVQPNAAGNQYQPALIQLFPAQNRLALTTTGSASAGGLWEGDNSLVNGLVQTFDASTGAITISARIQGPLTNLASPSEQGGILFGPDDDNYVKLVAASQPAGQMLQLVDEQHPAGGTGYLHAINVANSYTSIGSFASISTLDLNLIADSATGNISGSYSINGQSPIALSQKLTLSGAEKGLFFSSAAQAGIFAMAKNNLAPITVNFNSFAVTPIQPTPPPNGNKLTGTVIGTKGTYNNHPSPSSNLFDGNLSDYFDGPDPSGDWAGLNLGTPTQIGQVQYAPRPGFASRMIGGIFQGSNTPDFTLRVINLFTITAAPATGVLTKQAVNNPGLFQYVRYLSPANSYCNAAEVEFDGTKVIPVSTKLTGVPIGTAGSYGKSGNTIANAFDGNLATYFDGPTPNGDTVGLAFSSSAVVNQIRYAPRPGWESRMIGGMFQASVGPSFLADVVNLYTIATAPVAGVFTTIPISVPAAYKYVRYLAPNGSYGDVAELEFDGVLTNVQPPLPSVANSSPANNAVNVSPTGFVSCALSLPNVGAGVDPGTLTSSTVLLYRTFDHASIPIELNIDAVGSVIVLQPQAPLDANTSYTFVVTSGVTDLTGLPFVPYQISFTTGSQPVPVDPGIAFQQTTLPTTAGQLWTCVTMGPDGNLYASTLMGGIYQFQMNADGTLGTAVNLTPKAAPRLTTGIVFDPSSTATNMILWISNASPIQNDAPDFTGSISAITISGSTASPWTDFVVGLPRSNSNHTNDQPVFGPDGALYFAEASTSSMGAPDSVWGFRNEDLLSAAVLRLNVQAVTQRVTAGLGPLNVQTANLSAGQTAYDPYAAGAPLTLYATGVRNSFDLVWDSNGHLYAPTNGSAAGGNLPGTPAGVTPVIAPINGVGQAEDDYLYDIKPGGYYGHPDPTRGEYVFGGANPIKPAASTAIQGRIRSAQTQTPTTAATHSTLVCTTRPMDRSNIRGRLSAAR